MVFAILAALLLSVSVFISLAGEVVGLINEHVHLIKENTVGRHAVTSVKQDDIANN